MCVRGVQRDAGWVSTGGDRSPLKREISFLAQKRGAEQCLAHFPAVGRNNVSADKTLL